MQQQFNSITVFGDGQHYGLGSNGLMFADVVADDSGKCVVLFDHQKRWPVVHLAKKSSSTKTPKAMVGDTIRDIAEAVEWCEKQATEHLAKKLFEATVRDWYKQEPESDAWDNLREDTKDNYTLAVKCRHRRLEDG